MAYAVRSKRVGTPGFLRELEQAVWSVDRNLPLANVHTLEEIQARSMAQTSFALVMLGIAASVALLIGVVGIYGVIAYAATQRTREIGVRMALGAQTGDVRKMFLRHGLSLTATGIVLGIGVAVVLTRVMSAFLFGVGPMDPMTYAVVSGGPGGSRAAGDVSSGAPRLARRSHRRLASGHLEQFPVLSSRLSVVVSRNSGWSSQDLVDIASIRRQRRGDADILTLERRASPLGISVHQSPSEPIWRADDVSRPRTSRQAATTSGFSSPCRTTPKRMRGCCA